MSILTTADFNALARTYGRIPHSLNQLSFSDGRHPYFEVDLGLGYGSLCGPTGSNRVMDSEVNHKLKSSTTCF